MRAEIQGVKGTLLDFLTYIRRTEMYANSSNNLLSRSKNLCDVITAHRWGPTKQKVKVKVK
jgi:hypothetical protein